MQLATDASTDAMLALSKKLGSAKILLNCIDSGGGEHESHVFFCTLRREKESFPSAYLKFSESKKSNFRKMTQAKKMELKLALKEDMAPILAEAKDACEGGKLFFQEQLPVDPDECVPKLKEIKARKELEIEQLNKELEQLDGAVYAAETIQEIKRGAAFFDDACFTWMPSPEAAVSSGVKKRKLCE